MRGSAVQFSLRSRLALFFCAAFAAAEPSTALSLDDAERTMFRANADLSIAAANVDSAAANVTVAGQPTNPTLSLQTTQFNPVTGLGSGRVTDRALDTVVGISLPIERGDKPALRREVALEQLAGVKLDLREARRQQRLALHQAYYDLKLSEERRQLATETRELAAQSLAAADRRVKAGDLAAIDRYRLQVDALRATNDVTAAENEVRQGRVALATVMGIARRDDTDPTRGEGRQPLVDLTDLSASDPWPAVTTEELSVPPADIVFRRTDVAAAEARVAAANAGRALARSLRWRDVTIGAQVERDPRSNAGVSFGITASIPLFARYGFEGEISKAEADYSVALMTRTKVRAQAETELIRVHAALSNAGARLVRFERDIIPAAKVALDGIEFAYARGAAPLTDLLDARRTWRTTQADLAQARADHAKSLAAWRAATEWESVP